MEKIISIFQNILSNMNCSPLSFIISSCLIIILSIYYNWNSIINIYKKRKYRNYFRLDPSLENEMNIFRSQPTKLYFHFIHIFNQNKTYKTIYFPSQNKTYDIEGKDLIINYTNNTYPFYNINEKIYLFNENGKKDFIIVVNKFTDNHYNILIDVIENKKTFSLEIIIYSKIRNNLEEIYKKQNFKNFIKENNLPNILRFNIINARQEDLYDIYTINMEKEEKLKIDDNFFLDLNDSLLLNIIYSKNGRIAFRRIFENTEERLILNFDDNEINLLKKLYTNIIRKYINVNPDDEVNIAKFKYEFTLFDKMNGYSSEKNKENNEEINIKSDLRNINMKFNFTSFYIRNFNKIDISLEELNITEYLCYLNLILLEDDKFLDRIQNLIEKKKVIFDKYTFLTNKDKSLILINLLTNEKNNKSNYKFMCFYDIPKHSPYLQSELFFRKIVSQLNDNSSLSFLYLQLNSGSGEDYITKVEHYKIRAIPLIEIKYHLLKKFFYEYFFTYDSNNNIWALTNINTQILSFNIAQDSGYTKPERLAELKSENNMIKLSFLKFHEHAHIKFNGSYDGSSEPRYLLDDDFKVIDNKDRKNSDVAELNVGESGDALEYFLFKNYSIIDKLMSTKKNLSPLNDVNLFIQDNFNKLREIIQNLTKDSQVTFQFDKKNELRKKYKEKIKNLIKLKKLKLSKITFNDLGIEEIY